MTPTVMIVGCGALGSHVALLLRNEAKLWLVDGDRVEAKNAMSQHHSTRNVGKNKAQALQGNLAIVHNVAAESIPRMLGPENVGMLFKGKSLVIDCTDAAGPRDTMHEYAKLLGYKVPVLHAALAAGPDGYGQVTWDHKNYRADENSAAAPTCHAGEALPTAALVAAYAARSAQIFLQEGKRIGFAVSASGGAVAL